MGVTCDTGSMISRATLQSKYAFTDFFQWWETGIEECTAVDVASGRKVMIMDLPVMVCKGCWGYALAAYC